MSAGRRITFTWNGTLLNGVRQKSIAFNGAPIDITSGENSGRRTLDTADFGEDTIDISVDGVTKSNALRADWMAGNRARTALITYPDGATLSGTFLLVNYSDTGPYKDAGTFQASLQSTGTVVYTPAA